METALFVSYPASAPDRALGSRTWNSWSCACPPFLQTSRMPVVDCAVIARTQKLCASGKGIRSSRPELEGRGPRRFCFQCRGPRAYLQHPPSRLGLIGLDPPRSGRPPAGAGVLRHLSERGKCLAGTGEHSGPVRQWFPVARRSILVMISAKEDTMQMDTVCHSWGCLCRSE